MQAYFRRHRRDRDLTPHYTQAANGQLSEYYLFGLARYANEYGYWHTPTGDIDQLVWHGGQGVKRWAFMAAEDCE